MIFSLEYLIFKMLCLISSKGVNTPSPLLLSQMKARSNFVYLYRMSARDIMSAQNDNKNYPPYW